MAAKYELVQQGSDYKLRPCVIASATTITPGDLVTLSAGIVVAAGSTSAAIGYCPEGSRDGETICNVTEGDDFVLKGTGGAVFAVTYKGGEYDITDTTQTINFSGTTYKVLKIDSSDNAGTVGSTSDILVKINKPLF